MKGKPEKEKTGSGDQQDYPGKIFSLPAITDKAPVIEKTIPDDEQGGKEVEETKACYKCKHGLSLIKIGFFKYRIGQLLNTCMIQSEAKH